MSFLADPSSASVFARELGGTGYGDPFRPNVLAHVPDGTLAEIPPAHTYTACDLTMRSFCPRAIPSTRGTFARLTPLQAVSLAEVWRYVIGGSASAVFVPGHWPDFGLICSWRARSQVRTVGHERARVSVGVFSL